MKTYSIIILCSLLTIHSMNAQDISFMDGQINNLKKGDVQFEKGSFNQALKFYQRGFEQNGSDSLTYAKRIAKVNFQLHNYLEAEKYYEKVYQYDIDPKITHEYAEVMAMNENYEQAHSVLSAVEGSNEVIKKRKEGFTNVSKFMEDSVAYHVSPADFNTKESDFYAEKIGNETVFVSARQDIEKRLVFKNQQDGRNFSDLYKFQDGKASPIASLNGLLHQGPFTHVASLDELFITENYEVSAKNSERNTTNHLRISRFKRNGNQWVYMENLPFGNEDYSVGHPTYDELSNTLYFASNMPGGVGGNDIYQSTYKEGTWSAPTLVPNINTTMDEMYPFIDSKSNMLYFSSNGYEGLGGLDIYKISMEPDSRDIYNMGHPINSSKDDFGYVLNEDSKTGFLASNRDGGKGSDDIYEFILHKIKIKSKLVDLETGQPISGNIIILDTKTGKEVSYEQVDDVLEFEGISGRTYKIVAEKEGYNKESMSLKASDSSSSELVEVGLKPKPRVSTIFTIASASTIKHFAIGNDALYQLNSSADSNTEMIKIDPIIFGFGRLEPIGGFASLDPFIKLLKQYTSLELEIKSYADSRGTEEYNLKLTEKRASVLADYIINHGIDASRITTIGVGESELLNDCLDGVFCSDDKHALNRRVEFDFSR